MNGKQPARSLARADLDSLADRAYVALRQAILSCHIEPGAVATESQFAADLGFGKTPVREALSRLGSEGFVRPIHRRGWEVTPITIGGVLNAFEAFGMFMPQVVGLVAERATPAQKEKLAEMSREWSSRDEPEIRPEEVPHAIFIEVSGNPVIADMARAVTGHIVRIWNFTLLENDFFSAPEYVELREAAFDAMIRGDADGARAKSKLAIEASRDRVIATLRASPSLLSTPLSLVQRDPTA